MERDKIINKKKKENKIRLILFSILGTIILFLSIDNGESYKIGANDESRYLIENIDIEYRYDKENYEVSSVVNNPYAIVSGESSKINLLKLKKGYKFYIDLEEAKEGEYNLTVLHEGINKELNVEIYPLVVNVSLIEKEILSYEPKIEVVGADSLKDRDLIVGIPELVGLKKVRVRETQENLGKIGVIKGTVDVSDLKKSSLVKVLLEVFDREGNKLEGINLLENEIEVNIPIDEKVENVNVIVEEKVVENVIVEEKVEEVIVNENLDVVAELEGKLTKLMDNLNFKEKELTDEKNKNNSNETLIKKLEHEIVELQLKLNELEDGLKEEEQTSE